MAASSIQPEDQNWPWWPLVCQCMKLLNLAVVLILWVCTLISMVVLQDLPIIDFSFNPLIVDEDLLRLRAHWNLRYCSCAS